MFYKPFGDLSRWKMNVARAMGNSLDGGFVPDLIQAFEENNDRRVRGVIAGSLGRKGGLKARKTLDHVRGVIDDIMVSEEIELALGSISK